MYITVFSLICSFAVAFSQNDVKKENHVLVLTKDNFKDAVKDKKMFLLNFMLHGVDTVRL